VFPNNTAANYGQTRNNDDNYGDDDGGDGDCHCYISDRITMEKTFEK